MANKMLIDATHPEETRVAVVRGNRIEEFDFESANKKPLKGNIYLAKVVRVEPSLQAAFVEYGGNRHGFLAFSEIHPDYYQIPVADRERLLAEHARMSAEEDEEDERPKRTPRNQRNRSRGKIREGEEQVTAEVSEDAQGDASEEAQQESNESEENGSEDSSVENVNTNSDALDEIPDRQIRRMSKSYKIQEVIKKRQVMLIQVVKEERGNKGAALTTYLSLAGRYAVLMPNTARGGGISRKIGSGEDRKRLKAVADELDVPEGMGLIIRTAGAERTKVEIKRDYDYLLRVWDTVRDLTLASSAPALVYEEGSLIKRSLRDLYGKDVDEVIVEGEEAYREAKDFMKMLMPSHAKNVQNYKETIPLFAKHGVESQLEVMFQNQVSLRSGGYLVINQTEALVAIDVNSGRSTKEHNIEDTALKTNLEAADEVARQLRLRDMAGLVVIDFIDMEDNRNDRAVERRLKDALKQDRARIQVGRISPFGLMEMSRQRLRTSVLESTTVQCPHCAGLGYVRSTSSTALLILRAVEAALIKDSRLGLTVRTKTANALYILNQKRASLNDLETRYGISVVIEADDLLPAGVNYAIDRTALAGEALQAVAVAQQQRNAQQIEIAKNRSSGQSLFPDATEEDEAEEAQEAVPTPTAEGDEEPRRKRRRRRRRGRGRREDGEQQFNADGSVQESEDGEDEDDFVEVEPTDGALFAPKPVVEGEVEAAPAPLLQMSSAQPAFRRPRPPRPQFNEEGEPILPVETAGEGESNDNSRPAENRGRRDQFGRNRFRGERAEAAPQAVEAEVVAEPIVEVVAEEKPAKPARKPRETAAQKKAAAEAALNEATPVVEDLPKVMTFEPSTPAEPELPAGERKKGWWSKKILG